MYMSEKRSSHHFIAANMILAIIITLVGAPFLTPWQLFQQLCPYFSAQSPQCAMLQQQQPFLSQPYPQQQPQQQICPDGSLPDVNGNCPIIQQQQPSASLP
jgi:hypothetical protein